MFEPIYEPLRDPVTGEELDYDVEAAKWVTIPCTSGMEIEQKYEDVRRNRLLMQKYEWHEDLSGPYETALEPSIAPLEKIKEFVSTALEDGNIWEWKGYWWDSWAERERGCGCHIHMRPRPSKYHKQVDALRPPEQRIPGLQQDPEYDHPPDVPIEEVWATAYNTLIEVYPFILPLFCAGGSTVFRFRQSVTGWAAFVWGRISAQSMRDYLSPDYLGHPYDAVALNRKTRDKPLTLEIRLNESHPCITYVTITLLNRIIRKCFQRRYTSPKLAMDRWTRGDFYEKIRDAVGESAMQERDLYETLESAVQEWVREHGPIQFEEGREIPGLKRYYDSYFKIFRDITYTHLHFMNPVEYRVYQLFYHRGNPRRNWRQVWRLLHTPKGEFYWEDPYISGL
jgi:hypothetical protein